MYIISFLKIISPIDSKYFSSLIISIFLFVSTGAINRLNIFLFIKRFAISSQNEDAIITIQSVPGSSSSSSTGRFRYCILYSL